MKHLRKFESLEAMQTEIAKAAVDFIGLAYDTQEGTAKVRIAKEFNPNATPFYIDVRSTVTLAATSGLQMSTDGKIWMDTDARDLPTGKTYFRVASDQTTPLKPDWTEKSDSDYDIGGNINSLVKTSFENDTTSYKFYISSKGFFQSKSKLKSAGNLILPATTLAQQCYYYMFNGCTSLTTAPVLPATTLAKECYHYMFYGCTSLTTAPVLPATTLADSCYNGMFNGCKALTTAPVLPATTLANSCYTNMFDSCTSLTTAPELPATTLADWCYSSMFYKCTSLTTAPELPAMTMVYVCYMFMFSGCTSLRTAPELPATTLAQKCYCGMFNGCTSLTTAPALPATTLAQYCYSSMFNGCKALTTAPELPATTLIDYCYETMFANCTRLNYIKCLATKITASYCTSNWLSRVASTGTFVKNPSISTTSWGTGTSKIPSGWTVQNATV